VLPSDCPSELVRLQSCAIVASFLILTNSRIHLLIPVCDILLPAQRYAGRGLLAIAPCPSVYVCLPLTSRGSIEAAERIELVFGKGASFHPSCTVLTGNSVISKTNGTSLWNFVPNSGLGKFCFGISIVETCYQLSSRKVDAQGVINWTVGGRRQTSQPCLILAGLPYSALYTTFEIPKTHKRRSAKLTTPPSPDARSSTISQSSLSPVYSTVPSRESVSDS